MVDLQPEVAITHFRQDKKKDGGAYITTTGVVKRVDGYEQAIVLVSGMKIGISNIVDLDTEIFNELL
jgi:hypothetical protein